VKIDRETVAARLLDFGAKIIQICRNLEKTYTGRHVSGQLIRSATSAGANYEEACGAESRQDFIHKMQIVLKELRESGYWLKLIDKAGIHQSQDCDPILNEAEELAKIIAKSIVTAKANKK
jgi:four helix bundle protein